MSTDEQLIAGRELDALVAEKVLALHPIKNDGGMVFTRHREWVEDGDYYYHYDEMFEGRKYTHTSELPHFSTDIAAAWQVIEKLTGQYRISVHQMIGSHKWQCSLEKPRKIYFPIDTVREGDAFANAFTAPHAICLAALAAVGYEVSQ